jgi:hypothetical protein
MVTQRCAKVKIAIVAGLFTKWDMKIDACHKNRVEPQISLLPLVY